MNSDSSQEIESISAKVHAEFIKEKKEQGYHIPPECPVWLESPLRERWPEREGHLHCEKCSNLLYPVEGLVRGDVEEEVKEKHWEKRG